MKNRIDEIKDDELRVIGHAGEQPQSAAPRKGKPGKWLWPAVCATVLAVSAILILLLKNPAEEKVQDVFDQSTVENPEQAIAAVEPLGDYSDTTKAYTEHLKRVVNDIPLEIFIPHNAKPILEIGTPDIKDKSIVFATMAADIRADNGKINGAFVLAGEPMAWGLSKKGYVAIIDGRLSVGVADNSPLFEEATDKGGYFFRQYALVDNGKLVENEPKGKAIRKAVCDRGGEIIIVMSETPESFHDFAQALVDLQVTNAVYTVGSYSFGFFRDKFDHFTYITEKRRGGYKYENYLEWRGDE